MGMELDRAIHRPALIAMKRALLVGIDDYGGNGDLHGCVNDARALTPLFARHYDDAPNLDCQTRTSADTTIRRADLIQSVEQLVAPGADVSLFYFAGHGAATDNDVVLVTQDAAQHELGIAMSAILTRVNASPVREIVIILDCCFSGGAGGIPQLGFSGAILREGVSILAASRSEQTAQETPAGRGLFSTYLCGALEGGAADVLGKVTIAGLYAYLSESFGPWDQRPTFKANVDRLHELRRCLPWVGATVLRRLPAFFPDIDGELSLDSSYEPEADPPHAEHEEIFGYLQKCRAAKLVEPVDAEHMYFAAMENKSCRLTPLGKHYWRMAAQSRL